MLKIITYIVLSLFTIQLRSQDIFDKEHSERYADHLFEKGKFLESEKEYDRLFKMDPENIFYLERLLQSLIETKQYNKAIKKTDSLYSDDYCICPKEIMNIYLKLKIITEEYESCNKYLNIKSLKDTLKVVEYKTAIFMLKEDYEKATALLYSNSSFSKNESKKINGLKVLLEEAGSFEMKKPYIAGILSAVIPGSGKAYSDDPKNGFLAFSIIALYTWQSFRAFEEDGIGSVYGWTFGALAIIFYAGNIYGSYKSALKINKFENRVLKEKILEIIFTED